MEEFKVNYRAMTSDDVEKWRLHNSTETVIMAVVKGASQAWTAQALRQAAETVEKMSSSDWNDLNSRGK